MGYTRYTDDLPPIPVLTWMTIEQAEAEIFESTGQSFEGNGVALNGTRHYPLPADSGRKSALASLLMNPDCMVLDETTWIKVYDDDVFENLPNSLLFQIARNGVGETRLHWDAPVCRLEKGQMIFGAVILEMAAFFIWSAHLIQASGHQILISHDEYFSAHSPDPHRDKEIHSILTTWLNL